LGGLHTVRVFLLIFEVQWISNRFRDRHFDKDTTIKQRIEAGTRGDPHVMSATGADVQVVRQFAVEQHRAALIALVPQVFRNLAAREDRVDPRADVVGNPVHRMPLLAFIPP